MTETESHTERDGLGGDRDSHTQRETGWGVTETESHTERRVGG